METNQIEISGKSTGGGSWANRILKKINELPKGTVIEIYIGPGECQSDVKRHVLITCKRINDAIEKISGTPRKFNYCTYLEEEPKKEE
jgi:hypothetical protein